MDLYKFKKRCQLGAMGKGTDLNLIEIGVRQGMEKGTDLNLRLNFRKCQARRRGVGDRPEKEKKRRNVR